MDASQESQEKPGGNTKTPDYQAYKWVFTWPESDADGQILLPSQLSQELKIWSKSFKFQLEEAPTTKYRHYQGVLSLQQKHNMNTMKNIFGNRAHWERCKEWFAALNYSGKENTRIAGPWTETSTFVKSINTLRPWQKNCYKRLTGLEYKNDDRTILWYWCKKGNSGKTTFCKYMALNHNATITGNGAFKDLANSLPDNPEMVLMNLTRELEGHINYSALEAIKDGMMFSAKYKSNMKIFNSPVVCVFANFKPRLESMSLDRWEIHEINEDSIENYIINLD